MEKYVVDGQGFNVGPEDLQVFLEKYPNAAKYEEPGKIIDSAVTDPIVESSVMGSESADGSLESKDDDVNWFDQTWFGRGVAAASTTGEATDLFMEGSNVNMETIQEFIKAKEGEAKAHVPSKRMNKFQKQYKKEGSSWSAFFRGVKRDPALMAELFVQSLGTQLGTFADSDEARYATAIGAGAGAGAGSFVPGYGTVAGGIAGAMGGLATSMETALTYGELIQEELQKEGKEFTDVNIKALLESSKGKSIRNKALGRGLTIGAVEGLTGGIAGKVTTGVLKGAKTAGKAVTKTRKVGAAASGIGVESVGGGTGEVLGRVAAGQEMDVAEIGFEAITGTTTAPLNVGNALLSYKKPVYKLNGKDIEYSKLKDFIETADDIDVAKANIVMEDDLTGLDAIANKKQQKAIIKSQIDDKITDEKDIDALINLDADRRKAEADVKKKGIDKVPNAQENLDKVQADIDAIIGKYEGAADVAVTQEAADVRKAVRENRISKTIAFAETQGKKIGKETLVVDNNDQAQAAYDNIAKEMGLKAKDVKNADGFIVGDSIIINKDVAGRTGAINVGGHEVLHGILAKHMQSLDVDGKKKLISSFKNVLSNKQLTTVTKRLEENYSDVKDFDIETTDEWFTAFSDAIEKNEITFDEGVFDKVKNLIQEVLRKFNINKDFSNGRQTYNFLKDYSKSIKKNKLSSRALALAGEGATVTDAKASRSQLVDTINDLQQNATTKADFQKPETFNKVFEAVQSGGAINNYIRSLQMSPEKTQETIDAVTDRLINFDPAAKRKDGTTIGPEGLGEFIMANVGFGKLVAAKKLFVKGEKAKRETSIDTEEAKQVADKPTTKVSKEGPKARVLKSLADVNLDNKEIISATARAEIISLIEQNPKNLEEQITKIIEKEITKAVKAQMGKISNVKGEVVISDEYKAFIALNYENIVQGLDVNTIKNNYKTLFELTEIGKEDRKTRKADKPSLKKDSNYRKGIFKIETNKAKFTKFFTEGGYTTLLARQKGLANQIAKAIVEDAVNNEIVNNSTNIDAIIKAEIENLGNQLNRQKNEVVGNYADVIKFSKTHKQDITQQTYKLIREVNKAKTITDVFNLETQQPKKGEYDPWVIRTVFEQWMKGNVYANQEQAAVNALKKIPANVIKENRGTALEQFVINLGVKAARTYDGLTMLGESVMEGGIPDFFAAVHGFALYAETKFGKARAGKTSINYTNFKTGKFEVKKAVEGNIELVEKSVKKALKRGSKDLVKTLKDLGVDLVDSETVVPLTAHSQVNKGGLSDATVMVGGDFIAKLYTNKEYPVHLIEIAGAGVYYMEGDPFITQLAKELGIPKLEGKFPLKTRILAQSVKENKVTVGYKYKLTSEPEIEASMLNIKSPYTLTDLSAFDAIMKSKTVARLKIQEQAENKTRFSKSVNFSRTINEPKGITVLDFDDTLATTKSLVKYTRPDGTTGTLNAEQYAKTYENLLDKGYTFDFSDFNKVVKGKLAPLFQKALKLQNKFGPENMFILTARPMDAQKAIFDFLKANGLNIPMKNITGLGNSTAEAKALWIADKVGDGFNDFYFADDALQNTQAVKNMLDQFDVKSKVQQAKVKFSKSMNEDFNNILENVTGIESEKRFSDIKGRKRGESKGKFRFFIPPSHEDFVGLLYNFLGKGKEGNAHRDFFEKALIRPLNRANREYDTARQSVANDYKALNKQFEDVRKKLTKKTPDGDFTFQDAIRVYLWDKHGHKIPGLSETDQTSLSELVMADPQLQAYAETLNIISKQDTYVTPTDGWNSGDIRMDLDDATGRIGRKQFFSEFIENSEIIFSEENLNKIEAGYGKGVRESLEDMLYRIKTGRNRPSGQNAQVNKLMNYLNGSVGTVMFFNMRSALLQQMSIVNYINFADNNIFAAAKAFANQKQYWADWAFIFNSDMLKQRRGGIQTDVNGAELAASLRNSKDITRKLISKLLELGFLPTQIGDNIAIATGGAAYYRNMINKYVKQGMSQKEAEARAFTDFQAITQSTQQSARPDMVSKQQASVIGKVILNFQNITSQMNRIGKKSFLDIYNRRITKPNTTQMQSDISNAARITYYFAIQNAIFYTLQTALFAMMFDDDEEDDNKLFLKKKERLINGSIDSVLRGTGLVGGVVATLKNVAIAFARQRDVNYNPDESAVALEALNLSPVLGIKMRKIVNAEKTLNYNKKVIKEMETFDIDNPQWSAVTNYTEAFTNIPLNRLYNKTQNVRQALNNDHSAWERSLMFLGWSQYNLDLENKKMEDIKKSVKSKKKKTKFKGIKPKFKIK